MQRYLVGAKGDATRAPPRKKLKLGKTPSVATQVDAVIYEWCLDRIEADHPLFHTSYFGQVVRTGVSAQEAFKARTKAHVRESKATPKELGLKWAIQEFGADAFTVRLLETTRLSKVEAQEWANAREIALIAEHGGIMRDRDPEVPVRQTFNLTKGGQGDPAAVWQALEARFEIKWQRAKLYLQDYFADPENGHLRVPKSYVAPDGFRLGQVVSNIRSNGAFVKGHPERLAWLEARGWVASERDAMWEDAQAYLQAFFDDPENGHLRVPTSYVALDGFRLGQLVHTIRNQGIYVKGHPDRLAWLKERGWVANVFDAKWEDVQPYLQDYFADPENGHLRVPQSYVAPDGFRLGRLVHKMRARGDFVKGHLDRLAWLEERGWVANVLDAKWEDAQPYLQDYFADEGNLCVPQKYVAHDGFRLGQLVSHIRSQGAYVEGHPDRLAWLKERGWVANVLDAKWEEVQAYLQAFFDDRRHLRVPMSYVALDGFRLGRRVNKIRSRGIYLKGHPDRLAWLKERGFQMHAKDPVKNAARWAALEA